MRLESETKNYVSKIMKNLGKQPRKIKKIIKSALIKQADAIVKYSKDNGIWDNFEAHYPFLGNKESIGINLKS